MTVFVLAVVALAVLLLLALVHRWLWARLVRDTTRPGGPARRAGTVLAFALPVLAVTALVAGHAGAPFWLQRAVAWPGFMWLAVLLYLTMAMLVAEPVRRLWLRRTAARTPAPVPAPVPAAVSPEPGPEPSSPPGSGPEAAPAPAPVDFTRRRFVARTVGGAAAAAALATVGAGTYGVLRGPRVKRVQVPLARLPRAAHGFRIAVVSDVHLGPILGRAHTARIVETVNRTQPDLIAVVGDLVDGNVHDLGPAAEPLRGLRARHGSFFVTGNHEYFSGAQQWIDHVRELGLQPLENARRALPYFDLAGVNDVQGEGEGHGPDFQAALGDRDRSRTAVLLAHQPIVIHDAVRHGVDLQLSGHTHGGQLWPGNYIAELANPTVAGLERYGDTQLYVSRGAGAWGPPVRVGAPSDITVVELASYQA
ncbi:MULTISPECIES: metallophosphoesterase [unclassified Streptomyces]|uniref:metallophosphoesterase n=1 Tax=unclassified Streptomyces TaxID=2593676 RepID=UPI002E303A21|nr:MULTISPECIES: metallophosphoesterase [unclassified Streptomyces]WUC64978.1 metallophosphoesterase [Streptomyces sp. NBC_00539]